MDNGACVKAVTLGNFAALKGDLQISNAGGTSIRSLQIYHDVVGSGTKIDGNMVVYAENNANASSFAIDSVFLSSIISIGDLDVEAGKIEVWLGGWGVWGARYEERVGC